MPYWLTNPDHGVMPVYDMGEVDRNKVHGWTLLNVGPAPDRAPKEPENSFTVTGVGPLAILPANAFDCVVKIPETPPIKRKPGRPKKSA